MKKYLIIQFTFLIGFLYPCYSQDLIGKVFVTISDQTTVFPLDSSRNADKSTTYTVKKGTKFSVIGFDSNNNILVTFWRYYNNSNKKNVAKNNDNKSSIDSMNHHIYPKDLEKNNFYVYDTQQQFIGIWANYKQFAIEPRTLNSHCVQYFGHNLEFTWGVMTLPIKMRFGNKNDRFFDFEERLNLGFVFGFRQQIKGLVHQNINYLAGFGISSVRTDSISMKDVSFFNGNSTAALSLHTGLMYQYDLFQVGLFIGGDFVPGKVGRNWLYQGSPWIGLAIGVSLFSKNSTTTSKDGTNVVK